MRFVPDKDLANLNNNRGNNRRRGRGNNNNNNRGNGGGQQLNRIDSRARGNAPQMLEKYRKLASDAHLNGDRVQAEYYLQFADHYFRVMADTRVRQEEQRARQQGGERWQETPEPEDDGLDFSNDSDFPAFDRTLPRQEPRSEPREQQRTFEPRRDDSRRDDSRRDEGRREEGRNEAPREFREPRRDNRQTPFEVRQGDEGEPIGQDAAPNPFVPEPRGNRGLRPRNNNRFRRDEEDGAPAGLDPSMLPPALGPRSSEPEVEHAATPVDDAPASESAEAAPAPRKRGRPRKNPLPAADAAGEAVNG